jgi:LmbE family N-acetylglucosaminyl deacetylase
MAGAASKYNLLVVAHPDDETIFFGALLLNYRKLPWHVVCVTDANADGMGKLRKLEFARACRLLKIKETSWLNFPDVFSKRLDTDALVEKLKSLPSPTEVFTHGIIGEYGHPHHQDVSFAVHQAFGKTHKVWSSAYNAFPEMTVELKPSQYKVKTKILADIYGSETSRFMHILPATAIEGFVHVNPKEVEALYRYYREGKLPGAKELKTYAWLWPHLKSRGDFTKGRLF